METVCCEIQSSFHHFSTSLTWFFQVLLEIPCATPHYAALLLYLGNKLKVFLYNLISHNCWDDVKTVFQKRKCSSILFQNHIKIPHKLVPECKFFSTGNGEGREEKYMPPLSLIERMWDPFYLNQILFSNLSIRSTSDNLGKMYWFLYWFF